MSLQLISSYDPTAAQTTTRYHTGALGLAALGSVGAGPAGGGKVFLGITTTATVTQTVLTGSLTWQDSVYRLGANNAVTTTLTLGMANVLSGAGLSLTVGSPIMNAQTVVTGTGAVSVWAGQGYDGLTTVNRGSVLSLGRNTVGLSAFTNLVVSGDTLTAIAGSRNLTGDVAASPSQTMWNLFNTCKGPGAAGGSCIDSGGLS